jgi:hypothetical protein
MVLVYPWIYHVYHRPSIYLVYPWIYMVNDFLVSNLRFFSQQVSAQLISNIPLLVSLGRDTIRGRVTAEITPGTQTVRPQPRCLTAQLDTGGRLGALSLAALAAARLTARPVPGLPELDSESRPPPAGRRTGGSRMTTIIGWIPGQAPT